MIGGSSYWDWEMKIDVSPRMKIHSERGLEDRIRLDRMRMEHRIRVQSLKPTGGEH